MKLFWKIIILSLTFVIVAVTALNRNEKITNTTLNSLDVPYCFRFTWLGPKYNNESLTDFQNVTCDDLDISKEDPCRLPLVVTDNTGIPNTTWLWNEMLTKNRIKEIACRLTKGEVCAKIKFSYNQQVENITYMCTKVSIDGEGAAPNGCYVTDLGNGRQTEVCSCESSAGRIPCNNAITNHNTIMRNYWIKFFVITNLYFLYT